MTHIVALLLLVTALMMICASTAKHHKKVFPAGLDVGMRKKLKLAGWFVMLISYFFVIRRIGWGEGSVVWFGHVSLAAVLVITALLNIKIVQTKR